LCSRSQLRWRFFLFESWSSLSSTVFSKKFMGLSLGFVAAVLVLKMGLGLGFVVAVLVLKVFMGLGFVAAGAAKELVVVVGHILGIFMGARAAKELVVVVLWRLGRRRTWLLPWVWVGVGGLGCCHGCGGCWGNRLLPWMWMGVRGVWEKKI
jgi:hypothetical protein